MPGTIRGDDAREGVNLFFVAALDADAEFFDAGQRCKFGNADAQPRRLEIPDHHVGNRFRRMFEQ